MIAPDKDETYSEEETKRRAEATLKVMLATPHKPHKSSKMRTRLGRGKKLSQ
jgi:hypothetical protein